jgi:hypothetical protein
MLKWAMALSKFARGQCLFYIYNANSKTAQCKEGGEVESQSNEFPLVFYSISKI